MEDLKARKNLVFKPEKWICTLWAPRTKTKQIWGLWVCSETDFAGRWWWCPSELPLCGDSQWTEWQTQCFEMTWPIQELLIFSLQGNSLEGPHIAKFSKKNQKNRICWDKIPVRIFFLLIIIHEYSTDLQAATGPSIVLFFCYQHLPCLCLSSLPLPSLHSTLHALHLLKSSLPSNLLLSKSFSFMLFQNPGFIFLLASSIMNLGFFACVLIIAWFL